MTKFVDSVVDYCIQELNYFKNGKLGEDHINVYQRVGEYWQSIPIQGIDGRTKVKDKNGKYYNPAWSSAFISFIAKKAGANTAFKYTQAHCHYIENARVAAQTGFINAAYYAVEPYSMVPSVGDIICAGREYAKTLSFKQAELAYKADGFYPSHGDYVIEVNLAGGYVRTIGGNVDNSVKEKKLNIASNGRLLDRHGETVSLPWLALLKCRI